MKKFIDEARIFVRSGKGGDGAIAFLREKYRPMGGPAGGNGGKGGDVIFEVDEGLSTLLDFKYRSRLIARNGESGRGKEQYGHAADDLVVKVPPGTVVIDEDTGDILADLVVPGQRDIIAQGGVGGMGNMHFASSTRQAPRIAKPGGPAQERWVRLELRLVAEVGLVGMPNAGKSTLLSALSAARPKIASYPFTTLTPNLGRVVLNDVEDFTVADIPGLIEGAHEGHGLGIRFLRHISRTRILVFVLDVTSDIEGDFNTVRQEIEAFDAQLASRRALVALNKIDLVSADEAAHAEQRIRQITGWEVIPISAQERIGLPPLIAAMAAMLRGAA
ncbi:MAG TPA: GTPase ObgE [Candidatus Binataceae bacterium]|nr:GTPase ObgE [Candidatus Binataceae bacterium]